MAKLLDCGSPLPLLGNRERLFLPVTAAFSWRLVYSKLKGMFVRQSPASGRARSRAGRSGPPRAARFALLLLLTLCTSASQSPAAIPPIPSEGDALINKAQA